MAEMPTLTVDVIEREQACVADFMRLFGQVVRVEPAWPTEQEKDLRIRLIQEELDELKEAFDREQTLRRAFPNEEPALVEVADALGDLLYVLLGTAVACGINLGPVFREIHRSNMTKLWDDEPRVRKNEHGKVVKSPNYSPANVAAVLEEQTSEAQLRRIQATAR